MVYIEQKVHELYWEKDINCARTILICLGELYDTELNAQTIQAAVGLHGAGGFRAQCGLVEGGLMFIAIYFNNKGKTEEETVALCRQYAAEFTKEFGSLKCFDLRPNGFNSDDPPHLCESLTSRAVRFAWEFIREKE